MLARFTWREVKFRRLLPRGQSPPQGSIRKLMRRDPTRRAAALLRKPRIRRIASRGGVWDNPRIAWRRVGSSSHRVAACCSGCEARHNVQHAATLDDPAPTHRARAEAADTLENRIRLRRPPTHPLLLAPPHTPRSSPTHTPIASRGNRYSRPSHPPLQVGNSNTHQRIVPCHGPPPRSLGPTGFLA